MATFTKDVTFDIEIEYTIKANSDIANYSNYNRRLKKETFSGEKLEDCRESFSQAVGFDLTIYQMLEVVFSSDRALDDFCQISDADTGAKGIFSGAFGQFILRDNRSWPVGGDSEEYTKKFFDDLNEKAVGMGYIKIPC